MIPDSTNSTILVDASADKIEPMVGKIDSGSIFPDRLPAESRGTVMYVVAVQDSNITDVTATYASSWSKTNLLRVPNLLDRLLAPPSPSGATNNQPIDLLSSDEDTPTPKKKERLPTSLSQFKSSPYYVLKSLLLQSEAMNPSHLTAPQGMFKGEVVYLRSHVERVLTAKKWLFEGRKVRQGERDKPAKKREKRSMPKPSDQPAATKGGFVELDNYGVGRGNDGSERARQSDIKKGEKEAEQIKSGTAGGGAQEVVLEDLFGMWQTDKWKPERILEGGVIPHNGFGNLERELINPGLCWLNLPGLGKVGKKLGIDFVDCLCGFDYEGGGMRPRLKGVVVREGDKGVLMAAYEQLSQVEREKEIDKAAKKQTANWKRFCQKILVKDEIDQSFKKREELEKRNT